MARVRMFGQEFTADPVEECEGGYKMRARQHTARTAKGTVFFAKTSEIIEMAAAEQPGNVDLKVTPDGLADLDAAMAAERETLPSFNEIDATNGKAKLRQERIDAYWKDVGEKLGGKVRPAS